MKYVHGAFVMAVIVMCFGVGCSSKKSNTSPSPNPPTPPVVASGTSTWRLYEDATAPLRFLYPTSAAVTTYDDGSQRVRFDFSAEPIHPHVERKMEILHRASDKTGAEGLSCLKKTSWPSRLVIGGKVFSVCVTEGAGAGSRYRSYVFTPVHDTGVRFVFSVRYINDIRVISGCESGTSTQSACQPFNEETDTKIFHDVIATIRFVGSS